MPHLTGLAVHPVKSTAIRPVTRAFVGPAGLRGDREWMVVDAAGAMVSARELPALFRIVADTADTLRFAADVTGAAGEADGVTTPSSATPPTPPPGVGLPPAPADLGDDLLLRHPDAPALQVARPIGGEREVSLFGKTHLRARPAGDAADAWLRRVLGRDDVSLVWCDDPTRRTLSPEVTRPGDHAAFQDGYPVTVLSSASVAQVNAWMSERDPATALKAPLPAARFRANLLLDGVDEPFAEDTWARLHVGDVTFRHAKQVARCVMTTIDPADLSRGKDPIRTLARHRRWDGKTWCAVHLVPETSGEIRVGDAVTVEPMRRP